MGAIHNQQMIQILQTHILQQSCSEVSHNISDQPWARHRFQLTAKMDCDSQKACWLMNSRISHSVTAEQCQQPASQQSASALAEPVAAAANPAQPNHQVAELTASLRSLQLIPQVSKPTAPMDTPQPICQVSKQTAPVKAAQPSAQVSKQTAPVKKLQPTKKATKLRVPMTAGRPTRRLILNIVDWEVETKFLLFGSELHHLARHITDLQISYKDSIKNSALIYFNCYVGLCNWEILRRVYITNCDRDFDFSLPKFKHLHHLQFSNCIVQPQWNALIVENVDCLQQLAFDSCSRLSRVQTLPAGLPLIEMLNCTELSDQPNYDYDDDFVKSLRKRYSSSLVNSILLRKLRKAIRKPPRVEWNKQHQ